VSHTVSLGYSGDLDKPLIRPPQRSPVQPSDEDTELEPRTFDLYNKGG
jgi:hypothetical protein